MSVKKIKQTGSKSERAHIDNDHEFKKVHLWSRTRENELRQKYKKKMKNRGKNKKKNKSFHY